MTSLALIVPVHEWKWVPLSGNSVRLVGLVAKALTSAALASGIALLYSEILYQGTRQWYLRGKLRRYYPLPQERHLGIAWLNAFSFTAPTALFATFFLSHLDRSWRFNPVTILLHTVLYLLIHDIYFYEIHSTFHKMRPLYNYFHAMHHEYAYALNVYIVGYAEMAENFIQVGVPWICWTYIASANWWNWLLPLSLVLFTTLIGHSGYKMDRSMAVFHPLIVPFVLFTGNFMLTSGDHQVHHSHRRYNFGLFWRVMDMWHGTYRKCDMQAHDVHYWTEWAQKQEENSDEAKKWLGRQKVVFAEVEWGF